MRHGFSLIELMVVIVLIGIITAMGLPRFLRPGRPPSEQFMGRLNVLMSEAVDSSEQTHKVHKVLFNLPAKKVEIQTLSGHTVGKGIAIPDAVEIRDVVINGKSSFMEGGGEKRTVYILINPEGISQEVMLTLIDHKIRASNPRGGQYTWYLNPFTSVFRLQ